MLFAALLTIWLIYAVFIVRFVRKHLTVGIKNLREEDPAIGEKFDCFRRKDINKWNHLEMYFVAIFFLPMRVVLFFLSSVLCCFFVKLFLIGANPAEDISSFRRSLIKLTCQTVGYTSAFGLGFHKINRVKLDLADYDPTYPKPHMIKNKVQEAPILVSNHVSWIDIFLYLTSSECPCYMAKHTIEKYPIYGAVAQGMQCLFVQRESKEQRGDIVTKLKERVQKFEKNPDSVPQVLIFPEGTTSNGEYVLSFKRGAFANLTPVKIYAIKYHNKNFSPAYDSLGIARTFLFTLLQLNNNVTIYDLGVFYPDHLNLKSEDDWKIYADKVKAIMVKVLGAKSVEMGYADKVGYLNTIGGFD